LYLRLNADVTTLDPAYIVDVSGGEVAAKIFNGLVRFDSNMKICPDLAERYEVSEDGLKYTFYLRRGVRFSTGREMKSQDVKYSFERILNPATRSPRTWVLDRIKGSSDYIEGHTKDVKGIKILGDYVVELELISPFSPFIGFLAMPATYIVPKEEVEKYGEEFSGHVIGTGPFKLRRWRRGEEIVLERNELYFGEAPHVSNIVYRIIPEDFTAIAEFENGRIDIMGVPHSEFDRFTTSPRWKGYILEQVGLNVYYLGLNCQKEPFNKLLVRQAINYAIQKKAFLESVVKGRAVVSHGPIPPSLPGYNAELSPYPFDPDRARSLLKEAGYPAGVDIRIYQRKSEEARNILVLMQEQLKEVGFRAKIVQLEWSSFKEAINKGEPDAFYLAWIADYPDSENFLAPLFHSANWGPGGNRARYRNSEVDRLIELAQETIDPSKRIELYHRIERIIHHDSPWVFLWHMKEFVVHQPWVKGVELYPIYNQDKGVTVSLITEG
jgi:peptide/nickel transport system substrate-binding protein/oligopeptide transport system substrate-binding protein